MNTIEINYPKVTGYEDLDKLKKDVLRYYNQNLKGKSVLNREKGITVIFSNVGIRHVVYARKVGFEKLIAVTKLPEMIRYAAFSNFKGPDENDGKNILGYMNFKVPVIINRIKQWFRIVIRITTDGKFFYDHAVRYTKTKS
jgi:hypothetical protein